MSLRRRITAKDNLDDSARQFLTQKRSTSWHSTRMSLERTFQISKYKKQI